MEDSERQSILDYKQKAQKAIPRLMCPICNLDITDLETEEITDMPVDIDYFAYERGEQVEQGHYKFRFVICPECNNTIEVYRWEDWVYLFMNDALKG